MEKMDAVWCVKSRFAEMESGVINAYVWSVFGDFMIGILRGINAIQLKLTCGGIERKILLQKKKKKQPCLEYL